MQGLPADVRHLIYARCHVPDLLRWALVSKAWRAELRANGPWAPHVALVLYEFPEMHVFFDAYAKPRHRNDTRNRIAERPSKARKTSRPLGITPRGYWWVFVHVLLSPERHLQRYCASGPLYNQEANAIAFCITMVRCLLPKQRKLIKTIGAYAPATAAESFGRYKPRIRAQLNVNESGNWFSGICAYFKNGQIDGWNSVAYVDITQLDPESSIRVYVDSDIVITRACTALVEFIATGILAPTLCPAKLTWPPILEQIKAL